jgi:hypothetical protein
MPGQLLQLAAIFQASGLLVMTKVDIRKVF